MIKLPKVTFKAMSFNENMDMIAMFIESEINESIKPNTDYFKEKYIEIKDIDFNNMNIDQIKNILISKLLDKWNEEMQLSDKIIKEFQDNWNNINDNVMLDLSNRLNIIWPDDALNINARVGIMHYCPRYINERMFDIDINISTNVMREISIHEICHFLYFEKWKELYNDYEEDHYNKPHIIWYLSEAIIDPLLNNDMFKKYTNVDINSYQIFYDTFIDGISVIDNLKKIVSEKSIESAIKESYIFFKNSEHLIIN